MKIIYKNGNLLDCTEPWILHGCNAQGVMGSGVALAIKNKFPSAYQAYLASKAEGGMKLGIITFAYQEASNQFVVNGITQEFYGRDGKQYVDYEAVREVMKGMNWLAVNRHGMYFDGDCSVAMPAIGAGLGGGNWEVISAIIEEESINFQPVVYIL